MNIYALDVQIFERSDEKGKEKKNTVLKHAQPVFWQNKGKKT